MIQSQTSTHVLVCHGGRYPPSLPFSWIFHRWLGIHERRLEGPESCTLQCWRGECDEETEVGEEDMVRWECGGWEDGLVRYGIRSMPQLVYKTTWFADFDYLRYVLTYCY